MSDSYTLKHLLYQVLYKDAAVHMLRYIIANNTKAFVLVLVLNLSTHTGYFVEISQNTSMKLTSFLTKSKINSPGKEGQYIL